MLAGVWFLVVTAGYVTWVVWPGWDRESDLALAQALVPIAFAGFGFVVVNAAVLAFRPPQPELSCFARDTARDGSTFTIVNSGRLPASDVAIEIEGGRFGDTLQLVSPYWKVTERDVRIDTYLRPAALYEEYRTVLERSRSLPNSDMEVVFSGSPTPAAASVRLTASNAAAVRYDPSRADWNEWGIGDGLTRLTPREQLEIDIKIELEAGDERLRGLRYPFVRCLYVRCQLIRWRIFGGCPYSTRPVSKPVPDLTEDDRRP